MKEKVSKICTRCKERKPVKEFGVSHQRSNGVKVHIPRCVPCNAEYSLERWHSLDIEHKRKRYKQNQVKFGYEWQRNYRLTTKYGITLVQFNEMYTKQEGCCYICKTKGTESQLRVDHNHKTNNVRKLLCHSCNTLLGHAREDTDILQSCIEYLREHDKVY